MHGNSAHRQVFVSSRVVNQTAVDVEGNRKEEMSARKVGRVGVREGDNSRDIWRGVKLSPELALTNLAGTVAEDEEHSINHV
jgi:hypothetical protein